MHQLAEVGEVVAAAEVVPSSREESHLDRGVLGGVPESRLELEVHVDAEGVLLLGAVELDQRDPFRLGDRQRLEAGRQRRRGRQTPPHHHGLGRKQAEGGSNSQGLLYLETMSP